MLRCIAIDDEELALELLEDNIRKVPFLELVATCSNPLEAIKVMQEQSIDLVFLDIQMPGLTGLQFIQSSLQNSMFILVTAYEKYALESYNLNVVDYLVKPVEFSRFLKACNKALELYKLKNKADIADRADRADRANNGDNAANVDKASKPESKPLEFQEVPQDYFFVNVDYSLLKVMYADIIWIEGLKDYVKIHLKTPDKPIVARLSMKSLEEELPPSTFLRIHKSYIVSKSFVTAIRKNSVFIKEIELPIGENYKEAVEAFTRKS